MSMPDRVINFSLGRVSTAETPTDITGEPLADEAIYGQISNVAGGQVVYGFNESQGGDATYRYPNGQFSLADLTFTILVASERPESLGDAELVLDLYVDWYEGSAVKTQLTRYRGTLMNSGERTLDRTTDSPRTMTFVPYQHIDGGGADLQDVSLAEAGATSGAALYADSKAQVLRYRVGGTGPVVDRPGARRKAHIDATGG